MRMEAGFRLSSYLTLGLACICLAYAEQLFFPGIAIFVLPILALLALAYYAEGRWCLPIRSANLLGLAIALGTVVWIVISLLRPGPSRLEGIPLPVSMLPYLGPLLTILLVAKLFRPKTVRDLWVLHGMGLLQVALGCVMANDFLFGLLIIVYLACALWFLAQFHVQRELMTRPSAAPAVAPAPMPKGRARRGLFPVGRWTLAVTAVGVLVFLLIPRFGATQWHVLSPLNDMMGEGWPTQVGLSDMIDLHRTGHLTENDEVALIVSATDGQGRPKVDLSPHQRWRGIVLDRYHDGRWLNGNYIPRWAERPDGTEVMVRRWADAIPVTEELPYLSARQFYLDFKFEPSVVGGLILAEPVFLPPGIREPGEVPKVPVSTAPDPTRSPLHFAETDWTLIPSRSRMRQEITYRQVCVPLEEDDLSQPVRLDETTLGNLTRQRGWSLKEWTNQLLRDLAAQSAYSLSAEDLQYETKEQGRVLKEDHHEKVARALCNYLATSGEYTYTLDLRRQDRRLDPIEDFLRNVKQGHCERFASALALMLRSQGIPARVIKGFRGGENLGNGKYAIRHREAHSWVEALVPRPQPNGVSESHWLTLDPTSSIDAPVQSRLSPSWWMENGQRMGQTAWKDFVVEYDIDQQSSLWDGWRHLFANWSWSKLGFWATRLAPWLLLIPGFLGAVWLVRQRLFRSQPRRRAHFPKIVFYSRLLTILARRCRLQPEPAQTPREFGEKARQVLQSIPAATTFADLPARAADLLYQIRYGQRALPAQEDQDMQRQLEQLDTALGQVS